MFSRWIAAVLLLTPAISIAQQPVKVSFACAEDELQAAGLLCTEEEPCAIFLELSAIAPAGRKLFLAGNLHATSGTIASIFVASDDTGLTWKEPAPRLPGAAIEHLQFYDLEHGWAAGEIQYPLPRDPFFLLTTDGGLSWRRHPVSEDGGPGSVQRFWFDSAQHGELIVDAGKRAPGGRYLDYESETGGTNWMLRSTTSDQPKIKRAPTQTESSDFRIRPTPNGKTYQIEKRIGETWVPASSFLIDVASCKGRPQETKEPAAPPPARQ